MNISFIGLLHKRIMASSTQDNNNFYADGGIDLLVADDIILKWNSSISPSSDATDVGRMANSENSDQLAS